MSAILGNISLDDRPLDLPDFHAGLSALDTYGTDGTTTLIEPEVAFGFQAHHLNAGGVRCAGPGRRGPLTGVADAVLTDRADLLRRLDLSAAEAPDDTALIIAAYARWGPDCAARLYGEFAFAVHDRDKRTLFLCRDHIGIRPLYWARIGGAILFSTDIRGIVAQSGHRWEADDVAVARHLTGPRRAPEKPFFRNLQTLGAGSAILIGRQGERMHRWWSPKEIAAQGPVSRNDHADAFRALMAEIGRDHASASGAIGSHVSGGIDSCTVAALAARALGDGGRRLTAGYCWSPPVSDAYPLAPGDERHRIARVAEAIGAPMRYNTASGRTERRYLSLPLELNGTANLCDELPVMEAAEHDNLRVMLSGWGGDEAFSAHGFGVLAHALRRGHVGTAMRALRAHAGGGLRRHWRQALRPFLDFGVTPFLPDPLYLRFAPFTDHFAQGAFPSDAMREIAPPTAPYLGEDVRLVADPNLYLAGMMDMGHLAMRMETWAAWSAPHGFQYRYPLLDRRLLEFVLRLPYRDFIGDGRPRYLARAVARELLKVPFSKSDVTNEAFRNDNRLACWKMLATELAEGVFDAPSDWIDMPRFRDALSRPPDTVANMDLSVLVRIQAAARIYFMEQRFRGGYQSSSPTG